LSSQKIGIYGGTFDPVHHGHLILAREVLEKFQLGKILFIPAAISPHKNAPAAAAALRLRMLEAGIENEPKFEVDNYELGRSAPSFTIDTVEYLTQKYEGAYLFYLVGDDNVNGLATWRRYDELRQKVTFVVLRRAAEPVAHEYLSVDRRIEISASEVRGRVAAGQAIRYLVPPAVERIIRKERLYREVKT
jgi:nicotinate-nucleotide adenylyltransferase